MKSNKSKEKSKTKENKRKSKKRKIYGTKTKKAAPQGTKRCKITVRYKTVKHFLKNENKMKRKRYDKKHK